MRPNFYIAGAPKCGTSAIHQYMADRNDVFMCDPKEPAFWSQDFPGLIRRRSVPLQTIDDYCRLFKTAKPAHKVIGEGSTLYFTSQVAIRRILEFEPASKFLVLLRSPADFVVSFHRQKTFDLLENERDFEKAWGLQEQRRQGKNIPKLCHEPRVLQYFDLGSFGSQLQRAQRLLEPEQLHVLLLEDFQSDPIQAFEGILSFLGLPSEGRKQFPRINDARAFRFRILQLLYSQDAPVIGKFVRLVRRVGARSTKARSLWQTIRAKPSSKRPVSEEMKRHLQNVFEPEVQLLEDLLGKDLSHWRTSNLTV